MTDPTANQPPAGQQGGQPPAQGTLTPEQLAGLQQFQGQLAWVAASERAQGEKAGEKRLVEQLGMSVEDAVKKLQALGTTGQPAPQQDQQGQGQQTNPDLERRIAELEQRQTKLDQRETQLTERETAIKLQEQDGLRVAALEGLGMTKEQALSAKAMLTMPDGVAEMTPELAKASAEQLRTTFPGLFPVAEEDGNGNGHAQQGQQGRPQGAGGPPIDTHSRGAQGAQGGAGGSRSSVSAADRAKNRLVERGHVKPTAS